MNARPFFEFFAGAGMARMGLGPAWQCTFANDFDPMKARVYRENWGSDHFLECDINRLTHRELPGEVDLAWASFPCQDLSLAGNVAGLGTAEDQTRSGSFWAFWRLMEALLAARRAPRLIVLENVYGFLTSRGGHDFALVTRCLALGGYRLGAVLLDAADFVPQSRPRVFIVAIREDLQVPARLVRGERDSALHPRAMEIAVDRLAEVDRARWLWLDPGRPEGRTRSLLDVILPEDGSLDWHGEKQSERLLDMMSPLNLRKLNAMRARDERSVGAIYKRTRIEAGQRVQRAEIRDDGLAGCLRTPGGGSSRQFVAVVEGGEVRTRLLAAREAARLMGLPDSFRLPVRYNDAYHVAGDGVVVPVVRHLASRLLEPILDLNAASRVQRAA